MSSTLDLTGSSGVGPFDLSPLTLINYTRVPFNQQASITINGTLQVQGPDYTIDTTLDAVTFTDPLVTTDVVIITRSTPVDPIVNYLDGARLPAVDLNDSQQQLLNLIDEIEVQAGQGTPGPAGPPGPAGADGAPGPAGEDGLAGPPGVDGVGIPTDGTTGQVLAKASNDDYDTIWVDQTGGGGGGIPDAPIDGETYGRKDGSWSAISAIVGPTGPEGPQGPAGADGADGADGAAGADGAQGPEGPQGPAGADSTVPGPEGPQGPAGPAGPGIATGGSAGQVLAKIDGTDYATEWVDQTGSPNEITLSTPWFYTNRYGQMSQSRTADYNMGSTQIPAFSTQTNDTTNAMSSDGVFTIPEDGTYLISFSFCDTQNPVGGTPGQGSRLIGRILANDVGIVGTTYCYSNDKDDSGSFNMASASAVVQLSAGDEIKFQMQGQASNAYRLYSGTSTIARISGTQGDEGPQGAPGLGLPAGGGLNQVLVKKSGTDYDTEWQDSVGTPVDLIASASDYLTTSNSGSYSPTVVGFGDDGRPVYEGLELVTDDFAPSDNISLTMNSKMPAQADRLNVDAEIVQLYVGNTGATIMGGSGGLYGLYCWQDTGGDLKVARSGTESDNITNEDALGSNSTVLVRVRWQDATDLPGQNSTLLLENTINPVDSSNNSVNNIIKLTQAEYDGITPDPMTFYVIVG